MHWPLTGLLPPWAPGATHMLWRQRPDVSQRQLVLDCQRCVKTVIQGPCWRQFNGTIPVLCSWLPYSTDPDFSSFDISIYQLQLLLNSQMKRPERQNHQFWWVFNFFYAIFFPIWPHSHTYETNFEKNSALTWFSWLQWRLKVFTPAYRGLPPPTQLTNANIQR